MILVVANVTVKDGMQEQFIEEAKKCVAETIKEDGNISYVLKHDVLDKCVFTFVEQWVSAEALDKHTKSEHFKAFGVSAGSILAKELDINVYDAEKIN